jgi:hypothetical protein
MPLGRRRARVNKGLASLESLFQNGAMEIHPSDLENVNDNLLIEHQLGVVLAWAKQAGDEVVAATLQRALDELEAPRK